MSESKVFPVVIPGRIISNVSQSSYEVIQIPDMEHPNCNHEPKERLVAPKDTKFVSLIGDSRVHLFSNEEDSKENNEPKGNVYYYTLCAEFGIGHSENTTANEDDVCSLCLETAEECAEVE